MSPRYLEEKKHQRCSGTLGLAHGLASHCHLDPEVRHKRRAAVWAVGNDVVHSTCRQGSYAAHAPGRRAQQRVLGDDVSGARVIARSGSCGLGRCAAHRPTV